MTQRDLRQYLHDILTAGALVQQFVHDKSLNDYERDPLLRSAVERQFEIIGEALRRAAETDNTIKTTVSSYHRIVAFRNLLIHGYAVIENDIVWAVAESNLPTLLEEVAVLMRRFGEG